MNELSNITHVITTTLYFSNLQEELNKWLNKNYKVVSFETIVIDNNPSYLIVLGKYEN
jgi:hypothetical protein